jgi:dimethylamine/trimethylamine dehydrogenase
VARNAENDVLVVGAGPAGLECATVLAKRGMRRVHLVDAAEELGGCLRWISKLPGLGEWGRAVDYRRVQLDKLPNVEVMLGLELDVAGVEQYGAELVVLATGASWVTDGLSGATHEPIPGADASLDWQLTPDQALVEGKPIPDGQILVYDCDGYFMAASLAEMLALKGRSVTFVTPFSDAAPYTFFTGEGIRLNRRLGELGIQVVTQHVVSAIEPGVVRGAQAYNARPPAAWPVDGVVLVTQRRSNDSLWRVLDDRRETLRAAGLEGLYRIGDCVAPRLIADAIFDGHRLGREIDSDDPAVALPYERENLVLESPLTVVGSS